VLALRPHSKHAQEILQAYWDKKPKVAQVTKRKSTAADEPPAKRGRGRPPTGRTSKAAAAAKEESPDEVYYADTHRDTVDKYKDIASWEDLVKTVDTVERNHHNELSVYITMCV
jgi:hypothetical protein